MSKIILQEYKNEKIHTLGDNRRKRKPVFSLRQNRPKDKIQTYCDTLPVELEKKNITRTIEFSDVRYYKGISNFCLGNGRAVIKTDYYIDDLNIESKDLANTFNLDDFSISIDRYYKNDLKFDDNGELVSENVFIKYNGVRMQITKLKIDNSIEGICSGEIIVSYDYYICPNCNSYVHGQFYSAPKTKLLGMYIFDDEEHIKLTTIYKQVACNEQFAWNRYFKDMLIYKRESGKIYEVLNHTIAGSKYLKNKSIKTVKDITFSCGRLLKQNYDYSRVDYGKLNIGHEKFVELVKNDLKEQTGDMYEYTKSDAEKMIATQDYEYIYYLQIKKKYNIKNTILAKFIYIARKENKKTHSIIKNMTEKEIMNHYKLNTKRLKKLDEFGLINSYLSYFDLIDDINHINSLIENKFDVTLLREGRKYLDFYSLYKKFAGEKKLVNQLIKVRSGYTIIDTQRLFKQIKMKMKDYSIDYSRGIEDLHDIFSDDFNKMKHANTPIESNKYIEKVFKDFTINGITYEMAKETDELIKVGAFMDICVGGYGERAVNKNCYIIIGRDNKNNPVTCIEFTGKNKSYNVCQVKKRKNHTPKQSEVDALTKLFKKHNVTIATSDLKENRFKPLQEIDSEIIEKRDGFTYAVRVPNYMRRELIGEAI